MNPGEKLYRVNGDGVLEVVEFVEESLAGPDCTVTTYLVRGCLNCRGKNFQKFRVSKEMYVGSELLAWERYLREAEASVPEAEKAAVAAGKHWERVRAEVVRAREELVRLGGVIQVKDVFTCPDCGGKRLEEVMEGVVQSSEVVAVAFTEGGLACEYGLVSHDGGEVVRYQCVDCGRFLGGCEEELGELMRGR